MRLVDIDDERFWNILFEEACVEGEQAERIDKKLENIISYDVDKVMGELKENELYFQCEANDLSDSGYYGQATEFQGMAKAYKDAIEIVKAGGVNE